MKQLLIIRHFNGYDYLARLSIESWRAIGWNGDIVLYSESATSAKWCKDYRIITHPPVANFGGQQGAWSMNDCFKAVDVDKYDFIISSDADIVMKSNPFTEEVLRSDISGVGAPTEHGFFHYNAEFTILSKRMVNILISQTRQEFDRTIFSEMIDAYDSVVTDGHYWGYMAKQNNVAHSYCNNNWVHRKFFDYEPREDWTNIINEIKIIHPKER